MSPQIRSLWSQTSASRRTNVIRFLFQRAPPEPRSARPIAAFQMAPRGAERRLITRRRKLIESKYLMATRYKYRIVTR